LLGQLQVRIRLDNPVTQRLQTTGRTFRQRVQDVDRECAVVSPLLDNCELVRSVQFLPDFPELNGEKFTEHRADTDVGKIITVAAELDGSGTVVSVLRM